MIRCFKCFLVDHNKNIQCTMILHTLVLFICKYHFYYFDHVLVPSDYIHLSIMMTQWHFSPFINNICIICCGFIKGNGFRDSFLYGYEWIIINLPKLQYKTEHLAKYLLKVLFFYNLWPSYVSHYSRKYIS
jgi:hypothetical protein